MAKEPRNVRLVCSVTPGLIKKFNKSDGDTFTRQFQSGEIMVTRSDADLMIAQGAGRIKEYKEPAKASVKVSAEVVSQAELHGKALHAPAGGVGLPALEALEVAGDAEKVKPSKKKSSGKKGKGGEGASGSETPSTPE